MKKIFSFLLIISIIFIGIASFYYYQISSSLFKKDYRLFVQEKSSPELLFRQLANSEITSSEMLPVYLSKIKKLKTLRAGYYFFKKGTSTSFFINTLRAGRQTPVKLTFNNTRTLADFAGKIAKQLQPDSLTLLHHWEDENVVHSYGFDTDNFIGMFLPNTYEVYYTTTAKEFTQRMYKEYQRFWNTARKEKASNLGYSPQQISTLAAIVDEETSKNDEKARIARVYLNRLKRNIPLQADPTLKFAAGDFTLKRILNVHKEIESPYNTYQNVGLPPGPIRQPSISAINAVLHAEKHDYLYFCAKADFSGYHTFAKTLATHNQNAAAYHNALNKRGIR